MSLSWTEGMSDCASAGWLDVYLQQRLCYTVYLASAQIVHNASSMRLGMGIICN